MTRFARITTAPVLATVVLWLSGCSEKSQFYTNELRSDIFVQQYNDEKYDFLWVMDNSGSMTPRKTVILNEMNNFLSILNKRKAVDYQMAAATTDFIDQKGALLSSTSGLQVVQSSVSRDPVGDFGSIINNTVPDVGASFWEQGLETAYQAIQQHGSVFSRSGVPLILVFISDEDDYSCAGNCYGVEPEHNSSWIPMTLDRYISYFSTLKTPENSYVAMFNIIGTDYTTCAVSTIGTRYISVESALNGFGVSGSICDSKLVDSYDNIARIIADRGTHFALTYPTNGSGVEVWVNGQLMTDDPSNYVFDSSTNAIDFTGVIPSNGSTIQVTYNQITN